MFMVKIRKKGFEWVLTSGTLTGAAQALQHSSVSCIMPAARPGAKQSAFGKGGEKRGDTSQGRYLGNTRVTAISKGPNMGNMSLCKRLQGRYVRDARIFI